MASRSRLAVRQEVREDLLLPEGTRLLHIGPPKTATTTLQWALSQARPELARHGVVYPGRDHQHWRAALAVTRGHGKRGAAPPGARDWARLLRQVRRTAPTARVVISSEYWAAADDAAAAAAIDGLDASRAHVLVTLRPLARILPSAWQQYVRNGARTSYERWLRRTLVLAAEERVGSGFWRRHRHEELVRRWAAVAGADRVTVLVLDDSDRTFVLRSVEQMLGVPAGLLDLSGARGNRSLTWPEIELVRQLNIECAERGWSDAAYHRVLHPLFRAMELRVPAADETQIRTPVWALEHAARIGAEAAEGIEGLGVRVVGDLAVLGAQENLDGAGPVRETPDVPLPVASAALVATIEMLAEHRSARDLARSARDAAAEVRMRLLRRRPAWPRRGPVAGSGLSAAPRGGSAAAS